MTIRRFINRIHLYLGIGAAIPLILLSLTGALLVFEQEIDRFLNQELWYVTPQGQRLPYQQLLDRVQSVYPEERITFIRFPQRDDLACAFLGHEKRMIHVDPYRGEILGDRYYKSTLMGFFHEFHVSFWMGEVGSYIGGVAALVLIASLITGLVLWWPRGANKGKVFLIKWRAPWRRINFDLHRVCGFYLAPVVFIIALTGAVFTFHWIAVPFIYWVTSSTPILHGATVEPVEGASRISIDQAVQAAGDHVPNSVATGLAMPQGPGEAIRVHRRLPWQPYESGRTYIWVNPYTGKVVHERSPRNRSVGEHITSWNLHLHLGFWGGVWGYGAALTTRILWLIASLMPTLLAVTGIIQWWKPWRRKKTNLSSAFRAD